MQFDEIPVPDVYKESMDFRFFLNLINTLMQAYKNDTDNLIDLYDPLRCPEVLLWMLGDTIGFKYDDRVPAAFNRLILLYFMSMIRLKGSKDGVTLAAETNLAQFRIIEEGITGYYKKDENGDPQWVDPIEILQNRLDYTQLPVNSVYVNPHTDEGFIEVVYFSNRKPIDSCIEYVRPLGMYIYQYSGVKFEARTKISIDARLTNMNNLQRPEAGPTHVGNYSREDYARLQKIRKLTEDEIEKGDKTGTTNDETHDRRPVYYRNSEYEGHPNPSINRGYRSLYSLQLANNDHIVNSLIRDPESNKLNPPEMIFSLGYKPTEVGVHNADWPGVYDEDVQAYPYHRLQHNPAYPDTPAYNLRYDAGTDETIISETYVNAKERSQVNTRPDPGVNPIMMSIGDKITPTSNYVPHDNKSNPLSVDYMRYEQPETEDDLYSKPGNDDVQSTEHHKKK